MWLEGGCCHGQSPFGMQSSPAGLFAPSVCLRVMSSQKIIPPSKKRETWHSDKTSCQENTIFSTKIHNFWRKNAESSQVLHLTVHFGAPQTKKNHRKSQKKTCVFLTFSPRLNHLRYHSSWAAKRYLGGLGCWCNHGGWLKKEGETKPSTMGCLEITMTRWWQFQIFFFIFTPKNWGKWSNLTSIFFQMGWFNHQPEWNSSLERTGLFFGVPGCGV